jgi:hypothetical protein
MSTAPRSARPVACARSRADRLRAPGQRPRPLGRLRVHPRRHLLCPELSPRLQGGGAAGLLVGLLRGPGLPVGTGGRRGRHGLLLQLRPGHGGQSRAVLLGPCRGHRPGCGASRSRGPGRQRCLWARRTGRSGRHIAAPPARGRCVCGGGTSAGCCQSLPVAPDCLSGAHGPATPRGGLAGHDGAQGAPRGWTRGRPGLPRPERAGGPSAGGGHQRGRGGNPAGQPGAGARKPGRRVQHASEDAACSSRTGRPPWPGVTSVTRWRR